MVTALCNIFINSEEKFKLFKDTFPLVYDISDNWLIYIRGKYRKSVITFIKGFNNARYNCIIFRNLYEDNWARSTKKMLSRSKHDYIYIFLEDHFLMKPIGHFKKVIIDMKNNSIDYFQYSFFNIGFSNYSIEYLCPDTTKYFSTFNVFPEHIDVVKKRNSAFYPFALPSISSMLFFKKILEIEQAHLIKVPYLIQVLMENIFFFYPRNRNFWYKVNKIIGVFNLRFVIYPPATPFNLEKSLYDCNSSIIPYKIGVLKEELFANWDDDNKLSNSSLIKRGLYPNEIWIHKKLKEYDLDEKRYYFKKDYSKSYQYCPDIARVTKIPQKQIHVYEGVLEIKSRNEVYALKKGEHVWLYANIPHVITARENCTFTQYIEL